MRNSTISHTPRLHESIRCWTANRCCHLRLLWSLRHSTTQKPTLKNGFVWNTRTNKQLAKYVLDAQKDESCRRGRTIRRSSSILRGAARNSSWIVLFLGHTNDPPYAAKSSIRLLTDACLFYRTIKSAKDHQLLHEDLKNLEAWENNWVMRFNAKKCYILRIKKTKASIST